MKIRKFSAFLAAISLSVSMLAQIPVYAEGETTESEETVQEVISDIPIATNDIPGWPEGPQISSASAVVLSDYNNTVLYGKDMDAISYPGTTVKVMTMLLALENSKLEDEVTMTATGVSGVTDGGVSISAQMDETFTMEQCLYAIMLKSANDIALQVAEHVGGSLEEFVNMMNARAEELGCTNTIFTNPTGLPDENQHTTAHDMALIMKAAMENEDFRKIASAQSYTIPATNMSGGERALTNAFPMTMTLDPAYYSSCLGGKKGFTTASGETLMCAAQRNGMTLYCVILQGTVDVTSLEAGQILDYGFDNFHTIDFARDDFDIVEGGTVFCPITAVSDDFTIEDTDTADGKISRVYSFHGIPAGTATLIKQKEEDPTILAEAEAHIAEAKEFSEPLSNVPYGVILGIGVLLLIFLLVRMIKVIRS